MNSFLAVLAGLVAIALVIIALPGAWIGGKINGDTPHLLAKGDAAQ
jgi:hypothetical protein